jgi:twitching motility protein PilU
MSDEIRLEGLLAGLQQRRGSDLYLTADAPPLYRIDGTTTPARDTMLDGEQVAAIIHGSLTEAERRDFDAQHELNTARLISGVGRFRLNVFRQRGQIGLVARLIPIEFPTADELGLPPVLKTVVMSKRGLILVTGATGSGKSTTLAALVDHRNRNSHGHILTIEDPIEFVHSHRGSVITQREVGVDTKSFAAGLKSALRQAPDVILIGEMRDVDTVEAALHISETGHLVLGTMHANNANQAIERFMNFFPSANHHQIYTQLSLNLLGVISQRLLPRANGAGRVAAIEIMLTTPRVADLISKGEIVALKGAIEANAPDGSCSFDQALYDLYHAGSITLDEALRQADSANNLRLRVKMKEAGSSGSKEHQSFSIKAAT